MTTYTIRPRTDADLGDCVAVLQVLYETEKYPLGANRNLRDFLTDKKNQQCWVAVAGTDNGDTIVGHVSTSSTAWDVGIDLWRDLYPDTKETALLSRLFVLPQHRGAGVAAKLVEAAAAFNAKQEVRLLLTVAADSRAALRLYRRLGWVEYGRPMITLPDGETVNAIAFAGPPP